MPYFMVPNENRDSIKSVYKIYTTLIKITRFILMSFYSPILIVVSNYFIYFITKFKKIKNTINYNLRVNILFLNITI